MAIRSRFAAALVLGALAVIAVLLTGLSIADPFHLRHARWFTLGLLLAAIVLLTAALAAATRRAIRVLVLIVGTTAVAGWALLLWFAVGIDVEYDEVSSVADGDRRVVVLEGGFLALDPQYSVVVRRGGGAFEQETVVFQGQEGGPVPEVAFVDPDTVAVRSGTCIYRAEVEPGTLAVDQMYQPLVAGAC